MSKKNHSGVFLMEMIAVSFFFILCAAISIQTFVKADQLSKKASNLNQGVLIAQSVAEVWKAEGLNGLQTRFKAVREDNITERYLIGFDEFGNLSDTDIDFYVEIEETSPEQLYIMVSRGKENVYNLDVSRQESDS